MLLYFAHTYLFISWNDVSFNDCGAQCQPHYNYLYNAIPLQIYLIEHFLKILQTLVSCIKLT